jgi:hypothetical protein
MAPSWITWDHAKDVVQGIGYVVALWYTHRRTTMRLDHQDDELRRQSRGLEWNNEVTEMLGRGEVTVPPPAPRSSPMPPRPKVATLTDPFETYVEEAKKLDYERKR